MLTQVFKWFSDLVTKRFTGATVVHWKDGVPKTWEENHRGSFTSEPHN